MCNPAYNDLFTIINPAELHHKTGCGSPSKKSVSFNQKRFNPFSGTGQSSSKTGWAPSADNDINAVKNMGLFPEGIVVNPYLTDPDAFFIITDVVDGLKFIERTPLLMEDDNEFDTMNAKCLASHRYAVGWTDPRGIFGSPGA